ncbi:MAG: 3-hydroxyacyl-CoA dehydrogenase family protein, partial [Chloroflexota bacterium]
GFGLLPPITVDGMVELCAALQTTPDSMARAQSFWQSVGQTPHTVTDGVGLVRARIVCCVINEAFTAMHEGVATADDIDRAMRLGTNYPHGPFEWTELIGIETVLAVMEGLFAEWGEDRYRPAPLLRRMVAAGVTVSRAAP